MLSSVLRIGSLMFLLFASSGCVRAQVSIWSLPSALYADRLCPELPYNHLDDIEQEWQGWGFLGIPTGESPSVGRWMGNEVEALAGDGIVDLMIESDWRMLLTPFYLHVGPRWRVTAKVIKYDGGRCHATN